MAEDTAAPVPGAEPRPRTRLARRLRNAAVWPAARWIAAAAVATGLGLAVTASSAYQSVRERAFDGLVGWHGAGDARDVVVVDIDRAALDRVGPWPWGRHVLADLLDAVAAAKPAVIGLDILLEGPDDQSPAALARKLAERTGNQVIAALANGLPDGDPRLATALSGVSVVLGLGLDPQREAAPPPGRPVIVRGRFDAAALWREPGVVGPTDALAAAAAGFGVLSLPGEVDGSIRRVPVIVAAGGRVVPGLALETLRIARAVPLLAVAEAPRRVEIGANAVALERDGLLRLRPPALSTWPARTIAAADVLAEPGRHVARMAGRIVLIGSSAPEVGGLRPLPTGDLAPSVQLQADAVRQLDQGYVPRRNEGTARLETVAMLLGALLAGAAGIWLGPAAASAATAALVATSCLAVIAAIAQGRWLVDPLSVPMVAVVAFVLAALSRAVDTARREGAIRQRFAQHLAPAVVRRIVDNPGALKLEGEVRLVTAFFTDVEGFTALTDRAEPHQLIAVLDGYFDGVIGCVVEHGGLVDKIVGDAVHAIFNAPFDLDDHPRRALDCARAVQAFAERYRSGGLARDLGFGRTRIGIETGTAIVGDVGGARKLDYTAHGNAVNAAARLEAANKDLGTMIAVGSGAAAALPAGLLMPLGRMVIRGQAGRQPVATVWPEDFSDTDKRDWSAAVAAAENGDGAAPLTALLARHPQLACLPKLIERTSGTTAADGGG